MKAMVDMPSSRVGRLRRGSEVVLENLRRVMTRAQSHRESFMAPLDANLPEYSAKLMTRASPARKRRRRIIQEEPLKSYPVVDGSPWHCHHVAVLTRYISNFCMYAETRRGVNAEDLLLWAICCGATELARTLWFHCNSPLRVALVAQKFVQSLLGAKRLESDLRLLQLRDLFNDLAINVLESLNFRGDDYMQSIEDSQDFRHELLLAESDGSTHNLAIFARRTGDLDRTSHLDNKEGSVLELALELRSKNFIAHTYCEAVIDDLWCGRSRCCGRVRLRERPRSVALLLLQAFFPIASVLVLCAAATCIYTRSIISIATGVALALLALALGFLKVLPTAPNDRFEPAYQPANAGNSMRLHGGYNFVQEMLAMFEIPLIKRALRIHLHILYTILFVLVCSQPLCAPLNWTHCTLIGWLGSVAVALGHSAYCRRKMWSASTFNMALWLRYTDQWLFLDMVSTLLLGVSAMLFMIIRGFIEGRTAATLLPMVLTAAGSFVACCVLMALCTGPLTSPTATKRASRCLLVVTVVLTIGAGVLGFYYLDLERDLYPAQRCIFSNVDLMLTDPNLANPDWSSILEVLRVCLALAASILIVRCGEGFFIASDSNSGVLALCALQMLSDMFLSWLPLMVLVATSFGVMLSVLAPPTHTIISQRSAVSDALLYLPELLVHAAQSDPYNRSRSTNATKLALDLEVTGTFFAPFWGIFDL